jgi:hypothetical protein
MCWFEEQEELVLMSYLMERLVLNWVPSLESVEVSKPSPPMEK